MDRYMSKQPSQAKQPQTNNKQKKTTKNQTQTSHQNKKPTAQGESVIGWPVQQRRAMNEGVIALVRTFTTASTNSKWGSSIRQGLFFGVSFLSTKPKKSSAIAVGLLFLAVGDLNAVDHAQCAHLGLMP